MDMLTKLPREVQVILGAAVLYLIFSFFDWQQVSGFGITVGRTEWEGVGVIAGLLVIALLLWEAARVFEVKIQLGSITPGLISVTIALLLLLFTVITFLTHNEARHWPSWLGLVLSIVIGAAAVMRARAEGVQMPDLSAATSRMGGGRGSGGSGGGSAGGSEPPSPPPAAPSGDPPASA
jgi:hypothetical protein